MIPVGHAGIVLQFKVVGATRTFKSPRRSDLIVSADRLELRQRNRPSVTLKRADVTTIEVFRVRPSRRSKIASLGRIHDMGPYLWIRSPDGTLLWHIDVSSELEALTALASTGWPLEDIPAVGIIGALRRPAPFFE